MRTNVSCAAASVNMLWAMPLEKPPFTPRLVSVKSGAQPFSHAALIMLSSSMGVIPPVSSICHENGHRYVSCGRTAPSCSALMFG